MLKERNGYPISCIQKEDVFIADSPAPQPTLVSSRELGFTTSINIPSCIGCSFPILANSLEIAPGVGAAVLVLVLGSDCPYLSTYIYVSISNVVDTIFLK